MTTKRTARALTPVEIELLAARKDAKRIAVENFLMSVHFGDTTEQETVTNMHSDARIYKWNAATVRAINDGIRLAFGGR